MADVNLHIEELVMQHPEAMSDQHALDALERPLADRLSAPVIAEIRRAVSAAVDAACER
jgi:hypothetical protein